MAAFKWPKAIDIREKLDKGQISSEEYNNIIGNKAGNPSPNIQMVIMDGNNHLNSLPDINSTIRAMKKVDFVLVFSQYTELPTARYADILLPQIYTAFEGRNCLMIYGQRDSLFRIGMNLANYFLYCQKCVEPVGEVKSYDWVWTQIAKRLGIAEMYNPRLAHVPDDEWDEAIEELHREAYDRWAAREDIAHLNPPGWEEFQRKPVFRYEIKDPYYPFKRDLDRGANPFERTASGKIEFYSQLLAKGPHYLANNDYPPGSGKCYGEGNLPPMAEMTTGGRDTFHSKDSEKYPLLMSSPHSLYRVHSFLDNNFWLRDDCYRHAIWMSVADAKARGIKGNELVRVFNDIGEMIIPAYVTSRVVPGTVFIFHGGWYNPGKKKSELMPGRFIRVRRMKEQEEDNGDILAVAAAMQIIGASYVETLDTKGTDGSNVHLGGPETISGYFGGIGQPNEYALKWLDEYLYYYTTYGIKQVLNVNPGTVLLGYFLHKLGVDKEFKISVYMGNDNPYAALWTLIGAKLFSRDDGTSPLIGFNWSNSTNNETMEITAQVRKALGFEDVVRFEHHITETWKHIVRQPYQRRDELVEIADHVANIAAKHEGGDPEVEQTREYPSDILDYFREKSEIEESGHMPFLQRNYLDKHEAANRTARALTERGLTFVAARHLHR